YGDTVMKKVLSIEAGLLLVVVALVMQSDIRAQAAPSLITFTVDSTLDYPDDNAIPHGTCHAVINKCTLRAAIMEANRTTGPGADIIVPAGIYTLTIPISGSDGDDSGDLNLYGPPSGNTVINIVGAGAATTIVDANQLDRLLSV